MDMSGGSPLTLPMKGASRSARLRGRFFFFGVLAVLLALRGLLIGRTSTSVPSGSALGLSSITLPFLILPRYVMVDLPGRYVSLASEFAKGQSMFEHDQERPVSQGPRWLSQLDRDGYALLPHLFSAPQVDEILGALAQALCAPTRDGMTMR